LDKQSDKAKRQSKATKQSDKAKKRSKKIRKEKYLKMYFLIKINFQFFIYVPLRYSF